MIEIWFEMVFFQMRSAWPAVANDGESTEDETAEDANKDTQREKARKLAGLLQTQESPSIKGGTRWERLLPFVRIFDKLIWFSHLLPFSSLYPSNSIVPRSLGFDFSSPEVDVDDENGSSSEGSRQNENSSNSILRSPTQYSRERGRVQQGMRSILNIILPSFSQFSPLFGKQEK